MAGIRTRRVKPPAAKRIAVIDVVKADPKAVESFDFDDREHAMVVTTVDGTRFRYPMTTACFTFYRKHYVRR